MKSPHTLIKLHERAICIQEMIGRARNFYNNEHVGLNNLRTNKNNLWYQSRPQMARCIKGAWKYRRISNYLQKRYDNLLNNLK